VHKWSCRDRLQLFAFTWDVNESYPFAVDVEPVEGLTLAEPVRDDDSAHLRVHETVHVDNFPFDRRLVSQLDRRFPAWQCL